MPGRRKICVTSSLRSWVIWCGRYQWSVWGDLLYSVKTGESARNLASGTEGFGHHAEGIHDVLVTPPVPDRTEARCVCGRYLRREDVVGPAARGSLGEILQEANELLEGEDPANGRREQTGSGVLVLGRHREDE